MVDTMIDLRITTVRDLSLRHGRRLSFLANRECTRWHNAG